MADKFPSFEPILYLLAAVTVIRMMSWVLRGRRRPGTTDDERPPLALPDRRSGPGAPVPAGRRETPLPSVEDRSREVSSWATTSAIPPPALTASARPLALTSTRTSSEVQTFPAPASPRPQPVALVPPRQRITSAVFRLPAEFDQDRYDLRPLEVAWPAGSPVLVVLCDGVGGWGDGQLAAEIAIAAFLTAFLDPFAGTCAEADGHLSSDLERRWADLLWSGVEAAQIAVRGLSRDPAHRGSATSFDAALLVPDPASRDTRVLVAHVGCSSVWRIAPRGISHRVVGAWTTDEAAARSSGSPGDAAESFALGARRTLRGKVATTTMHPGELLLLASDGLRYCLQQVWLSKDFEARMTQTIMDAEDWAADRVASLLGDIAAHEHSDDLTLVVLQPHEVPTAVHPAPDPADHSAPSILKNGLS